MKRLHAWDLRRKDSPAENKAQQQLDFNYKGFIQFGVSIGIKPHTYNLQAIFDVLVKKYEKEEAEKKKQ
jgi:hypothetical protein